MTRAWILGLALITAALSVRAHAETLRQVLGAPHAQRVYDYAGVLSVTERKQLKERLYAMERKHAAQGAVILVRRVEGASIERFANRVLNRWGVGERRTNNGFVLFVAIDQRKWRLETGRGLRKKIPDATAASLMKEALVPQFRQEQYAAGLRDALIAIQQRASGSTKTAAAAGQSGSASYEYESGPGFNDTRPAPSANSGSPVSFITVVMVIFGVLVLVSKAVGGGSRTGSWHGGRSHHSHHPHDHSWMNSLSHSDNSPSVPDNSSSSNPPSSTDSGSYGGGSGDGGGASGSW